MPRFESREAVHVDYMAPKGDTGIAFVHEGAETFPIGIVQAAIKQVDEETLRSAGQAGCAGRGNGGDKEITFIRRVDQMQVVYMGG